MADVTRGLERTNGRRVPEPRGRASQRLLSLGFIRGQDVGSQARRRKCTGLGSIRGLIIRSRAGRRVTVSLAWPLTKESGWGF